MSKNQIGKMTSTMTVSEFIHILEGVKKKFGDLPVLGECEDCTASDMYVWVITAADETEAVIIGLSSTL
jgi:hypothetical protein